MALVTIVLEVRTDFDDPAKNEAMQELMKDVGRTMVANACCLQERYVPEVSLYRHHSKGTDVIELFEEDAA